MKKQSPFFFVFIAVASFFALSCGSASGTDNPYVELPYNVELSDIQVNVSSALRKSISKKIAGYNCNFTPKPSSKILMFSDSNDDVVPTKNSDDLFACFNARGFTMLKKEADTAFSEDNVYIRFETGTFGQGTHGTGSDKFMKKLAAELATW